MILPAVLEQKGMAFINQIKERRTKKAELRLKESINNEFLEQISFAKQSLMAARENFNFATDEAMTDYYIYMIKAEETKLNYFISLAKKENRENPHFFTPQVNINAERS